MMVETSSDFDWTVWSLTGYNMESMYKYLEYGEGTGIFDYIAPSGNHVGRDLCAYLNEKIAIAFQAYKVNDIELMEAAITTLFATAGSTGYLYWMTFIFPKGKA